MSFRMRFRTIGLLLIGFILGLTAPADAEPRGVRALNVVAAPDPADPNGAIWKKVPRATIPLLTAPAVHASISGTAVAGKVSAQAVRTGSALFIRLSWQDRTESRDGGDPQRFVDAVAVQFPLDRKPTTAVLMGNPGGRVNIWYWKAGNKVQNLFADGFGTSTRVSVQDVSGTDAYAKGTWTVVLSRPLSTASEDAVQLADVRRIPIGLAVWDGANRERDGFKAATLEWHNLQLR